MTSASAPMPTAITPPAMPAATNNLANEPLSQLRDLHLPEPVSWWPLAPGWWLLALLLIVAVAAAIFYLWRWHRDNRYRRLAIKELQGLYQDYGETQDSEWLLQQLSQLLRRVALVAFPREQVAALSGSAWAQFLADSGNQAEFIEQYQALFGVGLYQPNPSFEPEVVRQLCYSWLRKHKYRTWAKKQRQPVQAKGESHAQS